MWSHSDCLHWDLRYLHAHTDKTPPFVCETLVCIWMAGGILLLNAEYIYDISLLFRWMCLLETSVSQKHICTQLKCVTLELKFTSFFLPPSSRIMFTVWLLNRGNQCFCHRCVQHTAHHIIRPFHCTTFAFLLLTSVAEVIKNIKAKVTAQLWAKTSKLLSSFFKLIYWFFKNTSKLDSSFPPHPS